MVGGRARGRVAVRRSDDFTTSIAESSDAARSAYGPPRRNVNFELLVWVVGGADVVRPASSVQLGIVNLALWCVPVRRLYFPHYERHITKRSDGEYRRGRRGCDVECSACSWKQGWCRGPGFRRDVGPRLSW